LDSVGHNPEFYYTYQGTAGSLSLSDAGVLWITTI